MNKLNISLISVILLLLSCQIDSKKPSDSKEVTIQSHNENSREIFTGATDPDLKREDDTLINKARFKIIAFEFYELSDEIDSGIVINYQRIDLKGECDSLHSQKKAIINFVHDLLPLKKPEFIDNKKLQQVEFYLHQSSLPSIMSILQSERDITCNYKEWSETGSWAALSYYRELAH